MGEILACRVCMSTNVKLYDMYKTKLIKTYELLTGIELQATLPNKLPTCICGVCSTLLLKYTQFKETCQKTHELLMFAYQQSHEVSTEYIQSLKLNYHPLSNFSVQTIVDHNFSKTLTLPTTDSTIMSTDDNKESVVVHFETKIPLHTVKSEEFHTDILEDSAVDNVDFQYDNENDTAQLPEAETDVEIDQSNLDALVDEGFTVKFLTKEEQLEEIQARKLTNNYKTSLYKCDKCFKGFMTEVTYKNHLLKHDRVSGRYKCEVCWSRYPILRKLRHHNSRCHEREYKCKSCSFITKSRCQAIGHYRWHNGLVFVCNTCGATFRKASSHLSHVRMQHPSEHVCVLCGESFVGKRGLVIHEQKAHRLSNKQNGSTTPAMFACDTCSVQFKTKDALQKHIVTTAGDCTTCR
ncbi:hypothetical protein ACJJTC_012101 [Scirpophaga incertulas]